MSLYPPIQPYQNFTLDVGQGHQLHVELAGNPDGIPVVYLHGGPGGSIAPYSRRLFHPQRYHIICFDQRGCGKSTPFLSLDNNNTQSLVADIERLREHLNIPSWLVCGGSWGSTLALCYAIAHPQHVMGMVLRGIFLARQQDIDWFVGPNGAAQLFPEAYQQFVRKVGSSDSRAIVEYYHNKLTSSDELRRAAAARDWSGWEAMIADMHATEPQPGEEDFHQQLGIATLECHYMHHRCFLEENYILDNVANIAHIPGILVHGRYDIVCKAEQAFSLHQNWQNSELYMVPNAPHSGSHELIAGAFCKSTDQMAQFFAKERT